MMVSEPQHLPDVPGLDLAQSLYAKGVDVFNDCDVQLTEVGQRDPKVIALTILGRTLSEMRAVTLLVDNDQVVEARTLVRGMYENLFWAAALTKKGAEFVKEMALDDITARKAQADGLLQWAKAQPAPPEFTEKLGDFHAGLVADHGKTWGIKLQQAAAAGGVKDGYNRTDVQAAERRSNIICQSSARLRTHSQKSTVAVSAMADRKTVGHRSYRVATRRQSLSLPNMISIRLRLLYRRLSYLTGSIRDLRPGMQGVMPLACKASLNQSAS
jgi:hypothetical protein